MADKVLSFYDRLADSYHLIFEDWDPSIKLFGLMTSFPHCLGTSFTLLRLL